MKDVGRLTFALTPHHTTRPTPRADHRMVWQGRGARWTGSAGERDAGRAGRRTGLDANEVGEARGKKEAKKDQYALHTRHHSHVFFPIRDLP